MQDPADPAKAIQEADDYTPEELDEYLTTKLIMPRAGEGQLGKVRQRTKNKDGVPIGKRHPTPILDTRMYDVEFPDGSTDTFTANVIAENLFSQVDEEGRTYHILKEKTDHRVGAKAMLKQDGFITTSSGQRQPRHTTVGWEIMVTWKDSSTAWIHLKDLKDSNPVELAEYAIANQIAD